MFRIVLIIVMLIGFGGVFAVDNAAAQVFRPATVANSFTKTFAGTLNDTIRIQMTLTRKGPGLTGSYFYEKYKKNIPLTGSISNNGYFRIDETSDKGPSATFYGAFVSNDIIVGFWSQEANIDKTFPFELADAAASNTPSNTFFRPKLISANVNDDNGALKMMMLGDSVIKVAYGNSNASTHSCTLEADRFEEQISWQESGSTTTIVFSKDYLSSDEAAKVVIEKSASGFKLAFSGSLSYFCGVRAVLPDHLTITKGAKGWTGVIK